MQNTPVVISLPIADRRTSFTFYREGLGLDAIGPLAEDGVPEPLQFALNDGVRLMLVPRGGFGWVIADHNVASPGDSECLLTLGASTDTDADNQLTRAREAGAKVLIEPGQQPWGYAGTFSDPDGHVWMVTSDSFPT